MYDYEGQGSPAGSIGACSLPDSDDDLEFLNNLGSKFLKLAEICIPPKPRLPPSKTEQVVKSVETGFKSESSATSTLQVTKAIPPPEQVQQTSTTTVAETVNKSATLPRAKTSQTIFVHQQPLYYLVEQQIPNTVLVAENATQGMYVINGHPGTEGLILQGTNIAQATLSRGQQAMYLINGAPVAPNQPIQIQTDLQGQETVLGFSPMSSPIAAPGGIMLMPTQISTEAPVQGQATGAPVLLSDLKASHKKK